MGEQAFMSLASQPISATWGVTSTVDRKKALAMQQTQALTRRIYESVDAYNERMAKFREEHAKQVEAENTAIAEKRYNDILSRYLTQSTDMSEIEHGMSDLASLFRFANFNRLSSKFDDKIYLARKEQNALSHKLYKMKNGEEDTSHSTEPMLYSGEFQEAGKRDFLC